jgi:NTE family protein
MRAPPPIATKRIVPPMTFIDRARAFIGLAEPVPSWPPERLSLALQGGGSFGAFTWGVLDRLLEEPAIGFDAISGASAGAVNAVLLAAGMVDGGPDEARARLAQFWRRMSRAAALIPKPSDSPFGAGLELAFRSLSPYQRRGDDERQQAMTFSCRKPLVSLPDAPIAPHIV